MRKGNPLSSREVLELAQVYLALHDSASFKRLANQVLSDERMPAEMYLQFANIAGRSGKFGIFERAVKRYTERKPNDPVGWINMAATRLARNKTTAALKALRKAISVGGNRAKEMIRKDKRFKPLMRNRSFRQLVQPKQQGSPKTRRRLPRNLRHLLK